MPEIGVCSRFFCVCVFRIVLSIFDIVAEKIAHRHTIKANNDGLFGKV